MNHIETVAKWVKQAQQMQQQYDKLVAQVKAITGDRGMSLLLSGQTREYLPAEWGQAMDVLQTANGTYARLASAAQTIKDAQAVLNRGDLKNMLPQMERWLNTMRNASATQQAVGQSAYQTASERFPLLQQFIDKIRAAGDAKAIMDLQARIAAEQVMLQNEAIKLQAASQLQQAQAMAAQQMRSEMRVQTSGGGVFPSLATSVASR